MKLIKIVGIAFLTLFAVCYLAFLFVLPNVTDLNKYIPQITDLIHRETGFGIITKNVNIKTSKNLSICAYADKIDFIDQSDEKFAQINGLKVNISLFSLIFKEVRINKLTAKKFLINLKTDDTGEFLLSKQFLSKNSPQKSSSGFKLSDNMPEIYLEKYRVSILNKNNNYTLKGVNLKLSDFVLNKKIKFETLGSLILNKREQLKYNIAIKSENFPEQKKQKNNIVKIFEELYKYNIKGNILADLNIKGENTEGKIDIEKISFVFAGKAYPQSTLKLGFKGDKVKINAALHVDKSSKAIITGLFKTGKNKFINLDVDTEQIKAQDVLLIAKAMSKPLGIKELQNIDAKGILQAKFSVKSDFKKIESDGYLKIINASIADKLYKVMLNSINADIDFSQNIIRIQKATAKLNSQPIVIAGSIDKNALANIIITANNLPLKGALLSFGQKNILKENNITSGLVSIKAYLNGRLDKAKPNVNIEVSNANFNNIQSKASIKILRLKAFLSGESGNAKIENLTIKTQSGNISLPKATINLSKNTALIIPTNLYIDNIKTNLSGELTNIDKSTVLKNITISIPRQISVPVNGYPSSKIVLSGNIILNGNANNPKITGELNIPLIQIPSASTTFKNSTVKIDKNITLNCPNIKIANSNIAYKADVENDFTNGIILNNAEFIADIVDLNSLGPIFKSLSPNKNQKITIKSGKSVVSMFKTGAIVSTNVSSDFSLRNNVLFLKNMLCDSYSGKIAGDISYNIPQKLTSLDIRGRGLSANPAILAVTGRNDDINGKLDFDSSITFAGNTKRGILTTLDGNLGFIIHNGKMGVLGKFEHLLYAQNIISNNFFRATLNAVAKAVTVKNTGVYKYMKGKINFSNGWTNIDWIKTSGPSMSLYITGRYYLPNNSANLTILGRISDDVVGILGPIGEFSMNKAISFIPKVGEITTHLANKYTTNPNYENVSQIPNLTPKTEFGTKEFKVVIDGDVQKQTSVKSFKWLSSPKIIPSEQNINPQPIEKTAPASVPDFVKDLPDYKN